jgi:hypothetical protein
MMMMPNTSVQNHKPETWLGKGKQALREWWQSFDRLPSLNYKVKSLRKRRSCFMEYIRIVDGKMKCM